MCMVNPQDLSTVIHFSLSPLFRRKEDSVRIEEYKASASHC